MKGKKKSFYHSVSSKRMNKENTGSLLNGVGYLVTMDAQKAEVHIVPSLPQPSLARSLGHLS